MKMQDGRATTVHCLCLGPTGCGKSLLLQKLQDLHIVDTTTSTIPTVGTNLVTIALSDHRKITVRELGGSMAPLWHHYFDNINKIIFVVDTSNLCQIAAAGVLLYTILSHPRMQKIKMLVVLTKMDASYRQMRNEALLMLQYNRLTREIRQIVTTAEVSATTADGLNIVLLWLQEK